MPWSIVIPRKESFSRNSVAVILRGHDRVALHLALKVFMLNSTKRSGNVSVHSHWVRHSPVMGCTFIPSQVHR